MGIVAELWVAVCTSENGVHCGERFSAKTYLKMKSDFERFAKVHPAALIGYSIDPEKYMKQIGLIELAGATFLLIGPRIFKLFSCLLLSSVMIGAMYTLYLLADPIQTLVPAAVTLLALFIKLHFLLIGTQGTVDGNKH